MAVKERTPTEAQANQIPPTLRAFARQHCEGVRGIDRFDTENESAYRGFVITAEQVRLKHVPDGFEATLGSGTRNNSELRVIIREEW